MYIHRRLSFLFLSGLVFLVFFLKTILTIDPDLGWHLVVGEYILALGFPSSDPFSYTMPSFPFINHEWMADILLTVSYSVSPEFTAAIFSIVALFALLIAVSESKKSSILVLLFFLAALSLVPLVGIRIQVVSWLFFALALKVFINEKHWLKWGYFIPALAFIWANTHGSFVLAFALLAVFIFTKLTEKKLKVRDVLIVLLSISATLINPYGIKLWREVFMQGGDMHARMEIAEWLPGVFYINFPFILFVTLILLIGFRFKKRLPYFNRIILIFLLAFAVSGIRQIPFFIIGSLIILGPFIHTLMKDFVGVGQKKRLNTVITFALAVSTLVFAFDFFTRIKVPVEDEYPVRAVEFLKEQDIHGNLFSIYNWGGYLIWKYPEKKVFIDGRMQSWKMVGDEEEEHSAMSEYRRIMAEDDYYNKAFSKYDINYALLPSEVSPPGSFSIISYTIKLLGIENDRSESLAFRLARDGWKKEYEDGTAIIYSRPK